MIAPPSSPWMPPMVLLLCGGVGAMLGAAFVAVAMRGSACEDCCEKDATIRRLGDGYMHALEGEARAKQEAADLRVIVRRYEDEAAEAKAITERQWAAMQPELARIDRERKALGAHHRIDTTLPDAVCDSEAARELLAFYVGDREVIE